MAEVVLTRLVKMVFQIPEWYVMSKYEEDKLFKLVKEATSVAEVNWFRILDCSAFCREEFCYFCSGAAELSR